MKIIGLMLTWNNLEFFKCALKQALSFCDEVILVEGCHSKHYPKRSTDGTCEYIKSTAKLSKVRLVDFDFDGRYDSVQRSLRMNCPKESSFYELGNWIFHFDDDTFYFKKDLDKVKTIMETTNRDAVGFGARHFLFNFRFNMLQPYAGGTSVHRILEDYRIYGISKPFYRDGRQFSIHTPEDVVTHQYSEVKMSIRMRARFLMSEEKGTPNAMVRFKKWESILWDKDENIFKSEVDIRQVRPLGKLNIYNGPHPEWLDDHPWRNIEDVRRLG